MTVDPTQPSALNRADARTADPTTTTTKTVTATKEFASRVPSSSQNARSAAAALNKAATNVARDLVSWLAEPGRI